MHARQAAFLALYSAMAEKGLISDYLEEWKSKEHPSAKDFALAMEIANGSCRRALTLDAIALQLTTTGSLKLKPKEKALLRTALYQRYFMDRIPLHAIANETVTIAKKMKMGGKSGFFNGLLRRSSNFEPTLTTEPRELVYSFPKPLINAFDSCYGKEMSNMLLSLFNRPFPPMARKIGTLSFKILKNSEEVKAIAQSSEYYIQNSTPARLMQMVEALKPLNILDLCASPGGKLLLAHDLFPKALLHANDINEKKIQRLKENLDKYGVQATTSIGRGEEFPISKAFDLVLIDTPCSNSGVLHKRPEARWRYSPDAFQATQLALIGRASELLSPQGAILYMTCSILPEENQKLVRMACEQYGLDLAQETCILPDDQGADGGYAALIYPKVS